MKTRLYIETSDRSKNFNLQLVTDDPTLYDKMRGEFFDIPQEYKGLNLFLQGDTDPRNGYYSVGERFWLMFEPWSNLPDLFFDYCQRMADLLGVPLEIK